MHRHRAIPILVEREHVARQRGGRTHGRRRVEAEHDRVALRRLAPAQSGRDVEHQPPDAAVLRAMHPDARFRRPRARGRASRGGE
jgi:hypothetical protein